MESDKESSLKTYIDKTADSGGILSRSFCNNCGSNIFVRTSNLPGVVVVACGTLDLAADKQEVDGWKPEREYFCKRRGTWLANSGAPLEHQYQTMT